MAFYSDIHRFVSASARIARSFSARDARDALWNEYVNVQLEDYRITFSYAEARLEFNVMNGSTGDHVSKVMLHVYEGDRDDIPVITSKTIDRVASSLTEDILNDEEQQE